MLILTMLANLLGLITEIQTPTLQVPCLGLLVGFAAMTTLQ